MRIYRGQVPTIAEEITRALMSDGDIEVSPDLLGEVHLDVEATLNEYRRLDREIGERAKDVIAERGLDYSHTGRVRKRIAEKQGFGVGEAAFDWIIAQLIEVFLHSKNVDEVFSADNEIRRKIRDVLRSHTNVDRDLDRQVRARIRNMQEGTQNWEIEYERVMGDLRSQKRLD